MDLIWLIPLCLGAYLFGNINFSILFSRFKKSDIRQKGSGNAGSTNMLRFFGFKVAITIFIMDIAKGAVAAVVALAIFGFNTSAGTLALFAMGFACVFGHCFPVLFKFRGGKGMATTLGVFVVAHPIVAPVTFAAGLIFFLIFSNGAGATFITITSASIWMLFLNSNYQTVSILILCFYLLILLTHRTNIRRILLGRENKASVFKRQKPK